MRFLFRMQILSPDGRPIEIAPPEPRRAVPPAPPVASADQLSLNGDRQPSVLDAAPREISIPTRAPSTTIDQLEKEFHRKSSVN